MEYMKLPIQVPNWTESFLTSRSTAITFDNRTGDTHPINTGIPQGSPVSPILFLLCIQPLFIELDGIYGLWVPSFMDYLALMVQGRSAARNARRLEEAARVAFDWANNYSVAFDDGKTELLHLHRHRTRQRKFRGNDPPPRILVTTAFNALEKVTLPDGTVFSQPADDKAVRWLGMWFDRRMNFKYHIRQKAKANGVRSGVWLIRREAWAEHP
jgi:hypothetical protein